jgi:hypothetical protein
MLYAERFFVLLTVLVLLLVPPYKVMPVSALYFDSQFSCGMLSVRASEKRFDRQITEITNERFKASLKFMDSNRCRNSSRKQWTFCVLYPNKNATACLILKYSPVELRMYCILLFWVRSLADKSLAYIQYKSQAPQSFAACI